MRKHLQTAALIVLWVFITLPLALAHTCSQTWSGQYACAECDSGRMPPSESEEQDTSGHPDIWNRYIRPIIHEIPFSEAVINFFIDNAEHVGKAAKIAGQTGGPPNPMNAW